MNSNAQHTLGPWSQWRGRGKSCPRTVIRSGDGEDSALVCVIESGASEADRTLIAAAPQLLAALEDLVNNGIGTEAIKRAQAAIAAARGQACPQTV